MGWSVLHYFSASKGVTLSERYQVSIHMGPRVKHKCVSSRKSFLSPPPGSWRRRALLKGPGNPFPYCFLFFSLIFSIPSSFLYFPSPFFPRPLALSCLTSLQCPIIFPMTPSVMGPLASHSLPPLNLRWPDPRSLSLNPFLWVIQKQGVPIP